MRHHIDNFQDQRQQKFAKQRIRNLFAGMCVVFLLFIASHVIRDSVSAHLSNEKMIATHVARRRVKMTKWDYFPLLLDKSLPRFGILMGGTSDMFEQSPGSDLTLTMISTCINKLYAIKNQYAFKVMTNLEDVSNRTYGPCSSRRMTPWHKILLVQQYLGDVQHLLWIDLDAVVVRPNVPIHAMLNSSNKEVEHLGLWLDKFTARRRNVGSSPDPFFWASRDINSKYWINLNSAVFVLKNVPLAFDFLTDVWAVGGDPDCFKRFDWAWQEKVECEGYYGWPWEQGGIWAVLSNNSETSLKYLQGTVILPNEGIAALNSVTDQVFLQKIGTPFILHGKTIEDSHLYYSKVLLNVMRAGHAELRAHCPAVFARHDQFRNLSKSRREMLRNELSV